MIKVCALTSGRVVPSANFRVRQYKRHLHEHGIRLAEYLPLWDKFSPPPAPLRRVLGALRCDTPAHWKRLQTVDRCRAVSASYAYDLTWIQKVLVPNRLSLELKTARPRVFDLDDAIWLADGNGFLEQIIAGCDEVFVGNQYLANWANRYTSKITIVPTGVDTGVYSAERNTGARFVLGWIGTSGNYKYLVSILEPLKAFMRKRPDVVLRVIGERYPHELAELGPLLEFVEWHPLRHIDQMREFNVGLMPIADDAWSHGKCSYKMLQYMSMGIPVVVSPYGMNADVLALGEVGFGAAQGADWYEALETIYRDDRMAAVWGGNGRRVILDHFCSNAISGRIAERFRRLAA